MSRLHNTIAVLHVYLTSSNKKFSWQGSCFRFLKSRNVETY